MAKIIKRGTLASEYRYVYGCLKCASVIECTQADVQDCQREGDYVECPVCRNYINWDVVVRNSQKEID